MDLWGIYITVINFRHILRILHPDDLLDDLFGNIMNIMSKSAMQHGINIVKCLKRQFCSNVSG